MVVSPAGLEEYSVQLFVFFNDNIVFHAILQKLIVHFYLLPRLRKHFKEQ